MTLQEIALSKYEAAIKRTLTTNEARAFEAGWTACVVEYRKAEEDEYEEEAAERVTGCRVDL